VGGSWRMDKTYIKVRGSWVYLYRAGIRPAGGFLPEPKWRCDGGQDLAPRCDKEPAHTHPDHPGRLCGIASHSAGKQETGDLPCRARVRSSQYLNNLVEPDHRRVRQRIRPRLGFQRFDHAAVTLSGIELAGADQERSVPEGQVGESEKLCRNCGGRPLPLDHLPTLKCS
jgi:hypothetical protein